MIWLIYLQLLLLLANLLFAIHNSKLEWQQSGSEWFLPKESYSNGFKDKSVTKLKLHLKDSRIVFVGDSLTRYQYLNFIYILHSNSWVGSSYPHLELESDWKSWKSFHIGSSLR